MSPDEFKALIPQLSDSEIVSQVILAGSAVHVSESNITYLIRRIAESFGVNKEEVRLRIVGSANLAFPFPKSESETAGLCLDTDHSVISQTLM